MFEERKEQSMEKEKQKQFKAVLEKLIKNLEILIEDKESPSRLNEKGFVVGSGTEMLVRTALRTVKKLCDDEGIKNDGFRDLINLMDDLDGLNAIGGEDFVLLFRTVESAKKVIEVVCKDVSNSDDR